MTGSRARRGIGSAAVAAGVAATLLLAPAVTGAAGAGVVAPSSASADARIAAGLRARLGAPALGNDVALRVYDPAARRTVFASHSNEAHLPASNLKLVTAFDALTVLGPQTRLPTRVVRGSTAGSIVLVGGGDPLLTSADLRTLARRTVAALVAASPEHRRPARLAVSVDDTLFPRPSRPVGWTSAYGLGDISPVRALVRHGVASSDTTGDAMGYFVDRLRSAGIAVDYRGRTARHATGAPVAQVAGHRIADDVHLMLLNSDNQVAETLFRQVALRTGRPASWAGGAAAARSVLAAAGLPLAGTRFVDGSGLSRSDRVTAALLVAILKLAAVTPRAELTTLVPSLPVAGRSGSLKNRYRTAPTRCAAGIVKAKTGFINGVVALSGVARGADGRVRIFSILANRIPTSHYSVAATQGAVDELAATVTGCT